MEKSETASESLSLSHQNSSENNSHQKSRNWLVTLNANDITEEYAE